MFNQFDYFFLHLDALPPPPSAVSFLPLVTSILMRYPCLMLTDETVTEWNVVRYIQLHLLHGTTMIKRIDIYALSVVMPGDDSGVVLKLELFIVRANGKEHLEQNKAATHHFDFLPFSRFIVICCYSSFLDFQQCATNVGCRLLCR